MALVAICDFGLWNSLPAACVRNYGRNMEAKLRKMAKKVESFVKPN